MSNKATREWQFYLDDMIRFTDKIIRYTSQLDRINFNSDSIVYDATLRNLELIGEAANQIPKEIQDHYAEIPWRMMIATRNRLIHGYLGIDDDIIWSILQEDIPELLAHLTNIRNTF